MKFLPSRLMIAAALAAPLSFGQNGPYANAVISLNPLGYWKLDGNFNDATPHQNAGLDGNLGNPLSYTVVGGGAPIDPGGQAAVFNSSKVQYVNIPSNPVLNFNSLQPFTVMAWVKTANQGLATMAVVGKVDPTQTGYALVINNGPPSSPVGAGRFGLRLQSQGTVTEVESAVAVNDGAWHFLVATNDGSGFPTGIQLYLDGAKAAAIIDQNGLNGSILNTSTLTIGAIPAGGTALPFEGLIDEVAVFSVVLTQEQIQRLAGFTAGARKILPQFVFGGGWYSAIYFENSGLATVTFPLNFTADNGTPMLNVPLITGGATAVTLAPGTSTMIEAPNIGPLTQGYASFTPPPGIIGYGLFRQTLPIQLNKPDQEAVVPFSSSGTTTSTLLWDDTLSVTAFAVANPNPVPVVVTITVTKSDGSLIGTAGLPLVANGHTALTLRDPSLNLGGVVGNRGTAVFSVTSGNLAVLGLRATGIALTSIPTSDK